MFRLTTALALAISTNQAATAQSIEIGGLQTNIQEREMTPQEALETMDPLRLVEAYLVDKAAPRNARGGWGIRNANTFAPNEQIDAVIQLANVGKHRPGQPDNAQEMELYINIRDINGTLIDQIKPVHTFRANSRIQTPLQDDYFLDRFTVSARLLAPGDYTVGFVFVDRTRPADRQQPLEVPLPVTIAETGLEASTTDGVARQNAMPPMNMVRGMFMDVDASTRNGAPVARANAVFAAGEQIGIYAKFANVGRQNPGAIQGEMRMATDITITDTSGRVIVQQPVGGPAISAVPYPYDGPIPDAYFDSFKVTFFALQTPGTYTITLTFTDLARPNDQTQPVDLTLTAEVR